MNKIPHILKSPSSFTVVVLRSLMHGACVICGEPINSLEESYRHLEENLTGYDPNYSDKQKIKFRGKLAKNE